MRVFCQFDECAHGQCGGEVEGHTIRPNLLCRNIHSCDSSLALSLFHVYALSIIHDPETSYCKVTHTAMFSIVRAPSIGPSVELSIYGTFCETHCSECYPK